jgi:hypothetical protein
VNRGANQRFRGTSSLRHLARSYTRRKEVADAD